MDPTNLNPTAKAIIFIAALLFNATIIALLLLYGDPKNSFQSSQLWFSNVMNGLLLLSIGFNGFSWFTGFKPEQKV